MKACTYKSISFDLFDDESLKIASKISVKIDGDRFEVFPRYAQSGDISAGSSQYQIDVPDKYLQTRSHTVRIFRDRVLLSLAHPISRKLATSFAIEPASRGESGIVIQIDAIERSGVRGWCYNESSVFEPVTVRMIVDGEHVKDFTADMHRGDVLASGFPVSDVGFHVMLPARFFNGIEHTLEFVSPDDASCRLASAGRHQRGVKQRFTVARRNFLGKVDGFSNGAVRGWAIAFDEQDQARGAQQVLVLSRGKVIGQVVADLFRGDVAVAENCPPNCGFSYVPPLSEMSGITLELDFILYPSQLVLENSPCQISLPEQAYFSEVRSTLAEMDQLFTQFWLLKSRMQTLLPAESFNIANYHDWASKRAVARSAIPAGNLEAQPLVSVLCPTYRPRLRDFKSAVESVRSQTYTNWELVIVDDASEDEALDSYLKKLGDDRRIKIVRCETNAGISAASNAGLAQCGGKYVAFFDHDDLLEKVALERMVMEAQRSGAKILYSDEDKIDDTGTFSEPNFKPDFNYRLLLSQNYICHLLFVESALLKKTNLFRKEYDGAQDHDLLLQLTGVCKPQEIRHVPEILYHWRKTPMSTAESGASKPYATAAGVKAIERHLAERGLSSKVTSITGGTFYRAAFDLKIEPSVQIIIPYRDQIAVTERCLELLLKNTDYGNFTVTMVDNWSVTSEATAFTSRYKSDRVNFLRIQEPFNYSALNNKAAAFNTSKYLMFLNNDVLVSEPDWLRVMVAEAEMDEKVAVVGNRLLYPNGTVQHAGVVLGVGGVADHAFKGLTKDDPGYCARAICAQEYSAVTAACMLCRRDVFEEVGGFDEEHLKVSFNDIDLCLKIREAGYRIVWPPDSVAEHHESLSRGNDFDPRHRVRFFSENETMRHRWKGKISVDPYYNINFSRRSGIFRDLDSTEPSRQHD